VYPLDLYCGYNAQDFYSYTPIHQVDLRLASVKDIGRSKLQLQTPQVPLTLVSLTFNFFRLFIFILEYFCV